MLGVCLGCAWGILWSKIPQMLKNLFCRSAQLVNKKPGVCLPDFRRLLVLSKVARKGSKRSHYYQLYTSSNIFKLAKKAVPPLASLVRRN